MRWIVLLCGIVLVPESSSANRPAILSELIACNTLLFARSDRSFVVGAKKFQSKTGCSVGTKTLTINTPMHNIICFQ